MRTKELENIIDAINNKKKKNQILLRPIGPNVFTSRVWLELPQSIELLQKSDKIYFITEPSGLYVGAVYVMPYDLHWFVKRKHRKKGYLTNALKDYILPHIFLDKRKYHYVTVDGAETKADRINSKKVALNVGFKEVKGELILKKRDVKKVDFTIYEQNTALDEEMIKYVLRQNYLVHATLKHTQDVLDMAYGNSKIIEPFVNEIEILIKRLEDYQIGQNFKILHK